MKSKHRHELQTSELDKLASRATPFLQEHGTTLLYALGGLAVVLIAVAVWAMRSTGNGESAGWSLFMAEASADNFGKVVEDFPGTRVAQWARLKESEAYLETGIRSLFSDRTASESDLKAAEKGFGELLTDTSTTATVRERARIGMARTLESMSAGSDSDGARDKAQKAYEGFVEEFPDSIYVEQAKSRAETLKTPQSREFYAFFDKAKPSPSTSPFGNPAGPSGDNFDLPVVLPELPEELELPEADLEALDESKPDGPEPKLTVPGKVDGSGLPPAPAKGGDADKKASDANPPSGDEKPDDSKPSP